MLAAKAVVFAVLLLVVTEIVAFCSFFVGSAILHAHVPVSLGDPGVTRAVLGAGLYLTVLGLLALAIGTMIRHTAGSISTIIGVVFVLPILTGLLSSWGAHINAYLPEQAGTLITHTHEVSGDLLTPGRASGSCASGPCSPWPSPPTYSSIATPESAARLPGLAQGVRQDHLVRGPAGHPDQIRAGHDDGQGPGP